MRRTLPLILSFLVLAAGLFLVLRDDIDTSPPQIVEPEVAEMIVETSSAEDEATSRDETPIIEPRPWAHEKSELAPNERALFGTLDNGFRYVIMENAEPQKRVSLRLHIDAGSLQEADDQRGVAHFLEHMVFNGSKSFPDPKALIPQMQRLGIAFGAHANAYTSFDETVYMLDLPNLAEPTLQLAYTVMRDFADGALLEEAEIDAERGVILSEKNSRDSVEMRLMQQQFDYLLPNSLLTKRFPIGIEEVIKNAVRERFVSFYKNYYIPRRMTFIVVGDIDPAEVETRIEETFSGLKNPAEELPEVDFGDIPTDAGFRAEVFADAEVATDSLSLMVIKEATPEFDSEEKRIREMPLEMAHAMLSRRFEILAKQEGSPILDGSASRGLWFQLMEYGSIDVTSVDGEWEQAVGALETEFRRAQEYGFTTAEFAEVKANILNGYRQAVQREETVPSPVLAMQIVASINALRSFTSPAENLRILEEGLAAITAEDCHRALQEFWDTEDLNLTLTTTEESAEAQDQLLSLYEESQEKAVAAPEEIAEVEFAYQDFGAAGEITEKTEVEDLEITQLVLSNGVRVNYKITDFEKDTISLIARVGSGEMTMPADKPNLTQLANYMLNGGGLEAHSADELQRILAGETVSTSLIVGGDALVLSGRTSQEDLLLQLQLMAAYLAAPGYNEEAYRQYQNALPDLYDSFDHELSGPSAELSSFLTNNDPRSSIPTQETAASYTIEDVKKWIAPQLAEGYLELSVVGDFEPAQLEEALLQTFGALPPRATAPEESSAISDPEFPATPQEKTFTYESKIPRAVALVAWQLPGVGENIAQARRINILAEVLSDRMRAKIREELGATYSPSTAPQQSPIFPDYGYLQGVSISQPADVEEINRITTELAAEIAAEGIDADELDRALKPTLSGLDKSLRDNSYWLQTVLGQSQAEPQRLDWARERDEDYAAITVEEINELAKTYLKAENAIQVQMLPVDEALAE